MTDWNLDKIYKSFDDEKFINDVKKIDEYTLILEDFLKRVDNGITEVMDLEEYIYIQLSLIDLVNTTRLFSHLVISVDSKNTLAHKNYAMINEKVAKQAKIQASLKKIIAKINNLDDLIEQSCLLKEHSFFLHEIISDEKYALSASEEGLLSMMTNNSSKAWLSYKNKLIANHTVTIDGKSYPLTEVLNMAYDSSKDVRKKAYEAEIASYKTIEEGVAAALNAIKGEVLTVSDIRNYNSVIEMTLFNSRMDEETLNKMIEAMEESLPLFRKYLRKKAEILGYSNGLPWYELYAPVVQSSSTYSYDTAKDFVVKNFRTFSDELADYAKTAMDNSWIDVYPKNGKVSGAFCSGVKRISESRIMLNYGDSLGDIMTLAHELGHGYHNYCLKNQSILNSSYPMPLAETASILCETIVKKAAYAEASQEDKIMIIESELSDSCQVIVDIYSRFVFEKNFFEKRKSGNLSVEEIKELMLDAQKLAYGDGLDNEYLNPYMWTWKPHYYSADRNFYNFPYAFGLLFAKGLYATYENDRINFPKKYKNLLEITGKNSIYDVVKTIGIDTHDISFWKLSLKMITDDIEKFELLTK